MTEGQISFYSTDDVDNFNNVSDGAVIFSKRDEEARLADLFAFFDGGNRYQVKPSYSWDEITDTPDISTLVSEEVETTLGRILLDYFYIERSETEDGEIELKIFPNEEDGPIIDETDDSQSSNDTP